MDTTIRAQVAIPARIDRLPVSREIWGVLDSFLSIGYFMAPLIAFALIPRLPQVIGWRTLFYVGAFPLVYVPVLLKWMPESQRWLEVKGHIREANAIVSRLEHDAVGCDGGKKNTLHNSITRRLVNN
jgi:MFS transporter, putative metabolite:H+ symporter